MARGVASISHPAGGAVFGVRRRCGTEIDSSSSRPSAHSALFAVGSRITRGAHQRSFATATSGEPGTIICYSLLMCQPPLRSVLLRMKVSSKHWLDFALDDFTIAASTEVLFFFLQVLTTPPRQIPVLRPPRATVAASSPPQLARLRPTGAKSRRNTTKGKNARATSSPLPLPSRNMRSTTHKVQTSAWGTQSPGPTRCRGPRLMTTPPTGGETCTRSASPSSSSAVCTRAGTI